MVLRHSNGYLTIILSVEIAFWSYNMINQLQCITLNLVRYTCVNPLLG